MVSFGLYSMSKSLQSFQIPREHPHPDGKTAVDNNHVVFVYALTSMSSPQRNNFILYEISWMYSYCDIDRMDMDITVRYKKQKQQNSHDALHTVLVYILGLLFVLFRTPRFIIFDTNESIKNDVPVLACVTNKTSIVPVLAQLASGTPGKCPNIFF
jgi:hypothetical protein